MEGKITIKIGRESWEILKKLEKEGYLEYRDSEFPNLESFKGSDLYTSGRRDIDWYLNRNSDGTLYLTENLIEYGLIDSDYDAWHMTYILTDLGKNLLKNNGEFSVEI
jgi:hypothetical protein